MEHAILPETARRISAMGQHPTDPNLFLLVFDTGRHETFLSWFVEKHAPAVGKFLVKDVDGYTRVVDAV